MHVFRVSSLAFPAQDDPFVHTNSHPDQDDPFVQGARGFIGIVVAGHFPLNHHPARAGFLDFTAMVGVSEATRNGILAPLFTTFFVLTSVTVSRKSRLRHHPIMHSCYRTLPSL